MTKPANEQAAAVYDLINYLESDDAKNLRDPVRRGLKMIKEKYGFHEASVTRWFATGLCDRYSDVHHELSKLAANGGKEVSFRALCSLKK